MENVSVTVNKAIDILEVFLRSEGELSLTEIAQATGLNAATAFRLVSTLARRGYIRQPEKKGAYLLGLRMLDFNCGAAESKFIDLAYWQ
jgi:DNA-binding IclR family transcriptional regulator